MLRSDPMQVISGPMGREKVHFQAPECGCFKRRNDSLN